MEFNQIGHTIGQYHSLRKFNAFDLLANGQQQVVGRKKKFSKEKKSFLLKDDISVISQPKLKIQMFNGVELDSTTDFAMFIWYQLIL